jgi:hypothetical protein
MNQLLFAKITTVFGFLLILNGIYIFYSSIKPESKTYILSPGEKPFEGSTVERKLAQKGVRFIIYGFLLQSLKLIF